MIPFLFTLLSAGLTILAFPPFHWHPLALVAAIPFLLAIRDLTPARALLLGLVHGLAVFAGTLNWLAMIFGPMALLLFLMLALFSTCFAAIFATLQKSLADRKWLPVAIGVLWTGIEYFRCEWFTLRFPWITPGTALPPGYLTPLIGVYGMGLIVITGATAIAFRQNRLGFALIAVAALASYLPMPDSPEGSITVAAVQGEEIDFKEYLLLSKETEGPIDAFVWPEYALKPDIRSKPDQLASVQQLLSEKEAKLLTVGTVTEPEDAPWSNTAVTLGASGVLGTHDKNRPVHFFDDGEPGTHVPAFETPLGILSTPICFDNDYEAISRRAVVNGAQFFLVPSMDAEHWSARQHLQHAELARHRAAENGRWIAVASSSGLTQTIDPKGKRIAELPLFDPGVLVSKIDLLSHRTIYNRVGWLIGPTCALLTVLLLIATSILSRVAKPTQETP